MSDPDVVKELDHWIEETLVGEVFRSLLYRARDEIVALKRECAALAAVCEEREDTRHSLWRAKQARAEALEEAAQICEAHKGACGGCAFDIRALKDKPR